MDRQAAQAGRFYPASATALQEMVAGFLRTAVPEPLNALGVVAPHAGYVYSGAVAGEVFASVAVSETVILIGPNHTGRGKRLAILSSGHWQLPGLTLEVDSELAAAITSRFPALEEDHRAHQYEHALEVELPFLAARRPNIRFVPLTLSRMSCDECLAFGDALAEVIASQPRGVLVVASSDMNHFESAEIGRRKDFLAIDAICERDPRKLYSVVGDNAISMCGVIPTTIMLHAGNQLGASDAQLLRYSHSGEVNGDNGSVVGYAGIVIT